MGILEAIGLSPTTPHPSVPSVRYRITDSGGKLKLYMRCDRCGETFDWVCTSPERMRWRINTWAGWHRHGAR
jgi:hypothetical protein